MRTNKSSKSCYELVVICLIIFFSISSAFAQTTGGTLRGVVKDSSGRIIPNAVVVATGEETGSIFSTETSSAGLYSFPNLLIGNYSVTVEVPKFKKYVRKNVTISANQIIDTNVTLEVGSVSTDVVVTSGAEMLSTTSSQLGATIEAKAVSDLPNSVLGGSPLNLAILLPNTTTQGGGILGEGGSIGGNRPRSNNFTIDGVDNNNVDVTGALQPVIQDAVAEFNLISNQFSAEYGHSTAGQFNIITKSGTNQYHGSAFYYGQNRHLNAMDNLTKASLEAGDISEKPRFDFTRVGGTFGGPILKDKLFFFGAYEYQTRGEGITGNRVLSPTQSGMQILNSMAANNQVRSILREMPIASAQAIDEATGLPMVTAGGAPIGYVQLFAPDYEAQHDFQTNMDYNVGKHQIRGRFLFDRDRAPNPNTALPQSQFNGSNPVDASKILITDVWSLNSRMMNDFRISYSRISKEWKVPEAYANFPNITIDELNLYMGPQGESPQSSMQNTYQILDNISYLTGRHQIKAGLEYRNNIVPSNTLPRGRGDWNYASMQELIDDQVPGGLNGALRGAGNGFFAGNQQSIYWFLQDDIKATKNLTLNLGLRYEYTSNPRDASLQTLNSIATLPGVFEFRNPKTDKNNFGPRLGFAYSPEFGDGLLKKIFGGPGKSSIRGGFGIAYDVNFQNLVSIQLPPQLQTEQNPLITCDSAARPAWCDTMSGFLAGGGLLQENVPPVTQAEARSATGSLIVDQVAPKTYTWTLSYQRELTKDYMLEFRYMGTKATKLPVQTRLNSITIFEKNPELFIPTYFSETDIPASVSSGATSLADFNDVYYNFGLRYSDDGFDGGFVTAFPAVGSSIYHAGSVELTRRMAKGFYLIANYTWSRTIDDGTNELFSSLVNPRRPQDAYNLANERGLSALDMPHKFTFSWVYELPKFFHNSNMMSRLLDGWQINGNYLAESGQPITALSGYDANGDYDAAGDRAILNPYGSGMTGSDVNFLLRDPETGATSVVSSIDPFGSQDAQVVGYVAQNPNARFIAAREGTPDDGRRVGRNTIRTPGLNNWNISVFKNVQLLEGKQLQFRAEFYNAFNHRQPSLGLPTYEQSLDNASSGSYANVNTTQFLDASQFSGGNRSVQLSLKLTF
jgi:hypothetical protein